MEKAATSVYDDATLNFKPTVRQVETLLLLSDFSAELHWLVLDFLAACAEGNGRDDSCENDDLLHLLLSIRLVFGPSVQRFTCSVAGTYPPSFIGLCGISIRQARGAAAAMTVDLRSSLPTFIVRPSQDSFIGNRMK
jgi:hypothetical protein